MAMHTPAEKRPAILPFLSKLLTHHVHCETKQREEADRRREAYNAKRVQLESAVTKSAEYSTKVADLRKAAQECVPTVVVKTKSGKTARHKTNKREIERTIRSEAARFVVERQLEDWVREAYGDEGLEPPLPATYWQTAFQLLLGRYGLGRVLRAQRRGKADDGERDTQLRTFLARWR